MARKKKVLLVEPDYQNKYPPIGLMKLATYHKSLNYHVRFYKGALNDFLIEELTNSAIKSISGVEKGINWIERQDNIFSYIKQRRNDTLESILQDITFNSPSITEWLKYYSTIYIRKEKSKYPKWSRICISTLFTFQWKKTIETINFFKDFVRDTNQILIGGVLATLNADDVYSETGIKPIVGLLDKQGIIDDNNIIIDELALDYSILHEIDYKYPESQAFYGYMTRGCTRKCPFCAVPRLEPKFKEYIPIKDSIRNSREKYGDQCNLLLLDNNVLASDCFSEIINEIKECGFTKGAKFSPPNQLEIVIRNLKTGINDRAYLKLFEKLIRKLEHRTQGNSNSLVLSEVLLKHSLTKGELVIKKNVLRSYDEIRPIFEKYRNKAPRQRRVDFNQGVDARYLNEENIKLLSEIPINPLRFAFDDLHIEKQYIKAIKLSAKYGINKLSNYLLYNYKDVPESLYKRLKINVELCEEYDIDIYSFPMKYNPIVGDYSRNRDYLGVHWNRKFIRAIQAILNSTKGKIGRGKSFFEEAFGSTESEFNKLLWMPETLIIYRFLFKNNGITEKWWDSFNSLSDRNSTTAKGIIANNRFIITEYDSLNKPLKDLLQFYLIDRDSVKKENQGMGPDIDITNIEHKINEIFEYAVLPPTFDFAVDNEMETNTDS